MEQAGELADRARELGDSIRAHWAVISELSEERRQILTDLAAVWTQRDIAEELGVSQARVWKIINGNKGKKK